MQHWANIMPRHGLENILLVRSAKVGLGATPENAHNDTVTSQEILTQGETIGEAACKVITQHMYRNDVRRHTVFRKEHGYI